MPVWNEYSYTPLCGKQNTIRLVILHPSTEKSAPVTCHITEQTTSHNLAYTAVSYVWGKQEHSRTLEIKCDGDVRYLRITPNLDTVLQNLRARDRSRRLWIDAICLNQHDETEKAQQIPRMGDIDKMAKSVDIWLGLENSMTARLLKFFRELSRLEDVTRWSSQMAMARRIASLMKEFIHPHCGEAMGAINAFFQLPWFSRRWIIQEACLNSNTTVHCGGQSIGLQLLKVAATRFQYLDLSDYNIKVAANLGPSTTKFTVLELLWHFHDAACLEPKDRIAALLCLGSDGQRFHLDYTKYWIEIYKKFASCMYSQVSKDAGLQLMLHLFEFGHISKGDDITCPSWVPDWSKSRRRRLPYNGGFKNTDTFEQYPTSPGCSEQAVVVYQHGLLQIYWNTSVAGQKGHRVALATTFDTFQHTQECKTTQVMNIVEKLFPSIPAAKNDLVALACLLKVVSDFRHSITEREKSSRSLAKFERKITRNYPDLQCQQLLVWLRTLESVLQEFSLVEIATQNTWLGRGYGIGPKSMQVNDAIIPLWTLNNDTPNAWFHTEATEISIQLFTMLAVRCAGEGLSGISGEDTSVQTGRIIGPVTCVILNQAVDSSKNLDRNVRGGPVCWKQWPSARLI